MFPELHLYLYDKDALYVFSPLGNIATWRPMQDIAPNLWCVLVRKGIHVPRKCNMHYMKVFQNSTAPRKLSFTKKWIYYIAFSTPQFKII